MFSKKVSVWHVIYLILISVIVNVFLLTICPGRVSDAAMDNISFASTIVSIVLAVVSIVYSLQSGYTSYNQLDSIKNIEGNIQNELRKFQDLRDTISDAISPIQSTVDDIQKATGDIQKTTGDIQRAQDNINKNLDGLNQTVSLNVSDTNGSAKEKSITLTHTMVVSLYAAAMSKEKGMDIPFHIFASFIGSKSHFAEGMLEGLSALDDGIKMKQGSSVTRKRITEFNEQTFGTINDLKEKAVANPNKRIGADFIAAIDDYYSNIKNQQSKDSVE